MDKIIYKDSNGNLIVVIPTGEIPVEEVALKDVPNGVPFKYVRNDQMPKDRLFREAWDADMSNPDGTGIGHDLWSRTRGKK